MDLHKKALDSIFGDMDDMESKKMFGEPDGDEGTSITITVTPGGVSVGGGEPDHDESMCKGGCAYHKGGVVKAPENDTLEMHGEPNPEYKKGEQGMAAGGLIPERGETDDLGLPPFLRKKKKGI